MPNGSGIIFMIHNAYTTKLFLISFFLYFSSFFFTMLLQLYVRIGISTHMWKTLALTDHLTKTCCAHVREHGREFKDEEKLNIICVTNQGFLCTTHIENRSENYVQMLYVQGIRCS